MPDFGDLKRLHIDGLADYHCHTEYSIDATGTIDEYCEAALQRGLAEICLTTHYDSNPRADGEANYIRVNGSHKPASAENLAPYVEEVRQAWSTFYPLGLSVKLGLEFGWYPGCEGDVLKLKKMYDFDYLLCGVHELDDICFCCTKTYEKCFQRFPLEKMVELYYADATLAAKSGLFDTLAHLDYYKKFGERFYGPRVHEVHQPFLPGLFDALNSSNTAIEINTAALRKGFTSCYPQLDIINAARRAGVAVAYLGSDAHAPEQVAYEFESVAALVPLEIDGCDD